MVVYSESPFEVDLPADDSFRFQDIPAYKRLKGRHLKEMDFGWWDLDRHTLWLLELKDYQGMSPQERLPSNLLAVLRGKAKDTLLMLSATWLATSTGREIARSLPQSCKRWPGLRAKIKMVFVLRVTKKHRKADLAPLRDKLKEELRGALELFDAPDAQLLDHNTAMKLVGLPIKLI